MPTNRHETDRTVPIGPFRMDFGTSVCVTMQGSKVHLSEMETKVLCRLSSNEFRSTVSIARSIAVETYPEVMENPAINPASLVSDNMIWTTIAKLRQKLGSDFIESKRYFGYRLKDI